jgi:hypothetical protein
VVESSSSPSRQRPVSNPDWTPAETRDMTGIGEAIPDRVPSTSDDWKLEYGNWNLAAKPRLNPSKYLSLFLRKYRPTCLQPCRHLCLRLNSALCLNLYLNLNPSLFRWSCMQLLETLLQKLFAALFGSMLALMLTQLWVFSYLSPYRQMLPPRRPVGRGVDGRIAVGERCTTTCR